MHPFADPFPKPSAPRAAPPKISPPAQWIVVEIRNPTTRLVDSYRVGLADGIATWVLAGIDFWSAQEAQRYIDETVLPAGRG
jgi:hypothetical protein